MVPDMLIVGKNTPCLVIQGESRLIDRYLRSGRSWSAAAAVQSCRIALWCSGAHFLLSLSQAPWPLGVSCRWFDHDVFDKADFFSSTDPLDLLQHDDFFWTT